LEYNKTAGCAQVKGFLSSLSIRMQVIITIVLLLVVPVSGIGLYYYSSLMKEMDKLDREAVFDDAKAASGLLSNASVHLLDVTTTNSHWEDNRKAVETKDVTWLKENMDVSVGIVPNLDFIATIGNDGKVISQKGDVTEPSMKEVIAAVNGALKAKDISGLVSTPQGLTLVAVSKVTDETGSKPSPGTLIFGRFVDRELLTVVSDTLGDGAAIYSGSADTGWIATSDDLKSGAGASLAAESFNKLTGGAMVDSYMKTERGGKIYSESLTAVHDISDKPVGILYISRPLQVSSQVTGELKQLSIMAGIAALILISLIALIVQWRIISPLDRLRGYLKKVAEGQLSAELSPKQLRRKDEIGFISSTLQTTVSRLHEIVQNIGIASTHAATAADALDAETQAGEDSANRIAEAVKRIAQGADAQLTAAASGSKAMEGMTEGIGQLNGQTQRVAEAADLSRQHAEEGILAIRDAVTQMDHASHTVQDAVVLVRELEKQSGEIAEIVEWIGKIASQTNILALNANIEASRAGEHGKGFAVVADEVRKLAQQSDEAAEQVHARVEEIQSRVGLVISQIENGSMEVAGGTRLIHRAETSFTQIADTVVHIGSELQEAAAVAKEMNAVSNEMAMVVGQTESVSREAAEQTKEVAGVTEAQAASMRRITSSIKSLHEQIQLLETAVRDYR
jgi:methyl-accepting chemotaxis protein